MTPAEMADWLEDFASPDYADEESMAVFDAIVAHLKRQPTDAQKIEALDAMGDAAYCASRGLRLLAEYQLDDIGFERLREGISGARAAMRLLGLNPEGV